MNDSLQINLFAVLLHYPVVNKNGDVIVSSVTNLDLHDIARASKTYGIKKFYVVTPLMDQKDLVEKVTNHWTCGFGSKYNPKRKDALDIIRIKDTIEEVIEEVESIYGTTPKIVVTCAKEHDKCITFGMLSNMLKDGTPYLLNFGTAWGLSDEFIEKADCILEPIRGAGDYNHLSVRSAASIIFDRLVNR